MIKKLLITSALISALLFAGVSCQPVSFNTQRATATAYALSYMTDAMTAAENGAMALCEIDFEEGKDTYINSICEASTNLGCEFFTQQLNAAWNDLERSYASEKLGCLPGTSKFIESGSQFGMDVQYWFITLQATEGWGAEAGSREYWLQVAEENSNWKLNRVLTGDEVAYYLTITAMAGEE